jgi:hypothetical protein
MRKIAILCAFLALCGCGHSQTAEQIAAAQDQKCRNFGAKPGTQAYIDCRLQLDRQVHEATLQRQAAAAALLSDNPYRPPPPAQFPSSPTAPMPSWNNTIHCNSQNQGWGRSETTCQ